MQAFLNGVATCASLIAGVQFARFWRDTGDRLFLWFALAFWMFASNWAATAVLNPAEEARHLYYLLRLAGFVLILIGVYDKNRSKRLT
jgi:hypothetical protein